MIIVALAIFTGFIGIVIAIVCDQIEIKNGREW